MVIFKCFSIAVIDTDTLPTVSNYGGLRYSDSDAIVNFGRTEMSFAESDFTFGLKLLSLHLAMIA